MAITGHLHLVERDHLSWWLAERQLPSGGLNGRPEKLPDVCYSWWGFIFCEDVNQSRWVLASLAVLGRLHWVDKEKLTNFILACQVDNITQTTSLVIDNSLLIILPLLAWHFISAH